MAYDDDAHVADQRHRYQERLTYLAGVLADAGVPTPLPAGGFYLWVPVPTGFGHGGNGGAWALTEALAMEGGLLASPGDLYGPDGAGHVRVAVVQPTERLELVARRLAGRRLPPGPTA